MVLRASEQDNLLGFELCSDGSMNGVLRLPYQAQAVPLTDSTTVQQGTFTPITMNGREVYKFAVSRVPEVIEKANEQEVTLLSTSLPTFEVVGKLWEMGVRQG